MSHDPDYWKFSNEDGKLERCDMKQFEKDLAAAVAYQKQLEKAMSVTVQDGDGNDYELTECECNNTHAQDDTVCRWCWEQNIRRSVRK